MPNQKQRMGTLYSSHFKRARQGEEAQSVFANSCKLMNEWEGGSSPGMATEERTVLGRVTTICGSALKIALYIYIQTACTHSRERTHTTVEAKWQHYRAEASGKLRVQTPHQLSSIVCIPSTWESCRRRTPSIYIHSYENKEREIVCCEWQFFCAALHAHLEWMQPPYCSFGDDLLMNYVLMKNSGGGVEERVCVIIVF